MGSRYALRETEGAIGLDCRRLMDGRAAVFRHTPIHKRSRRDFLERRDTMSVLVSSMTATASICSRPGISLDSAVGMVNGIRTSLIKTVFPYLDVDDSSANAKEEDYDAYFDELDRIEEEERKERENAPANTGGEAPGNGAEASEMV